MTEPVSDIEDADPGLARERTELAWTRTAISLAALGLAILRSHPAIAAPVLLFSAVAWWIGRLPRSAATPEAVARRVRLTAAAITAMALVALVIALAR
jgi:uncharacterized membrane protein YidH (DUF202 family)